MASNQADGTRCASRRGAEETPNSGSLDSALLALHGAVGVEELWRGLVGTLRAALPARNVALTLSPTELHPGFYRLDHPMPDSELYFAKLDAMAPLSITAASMQRPARVLRTSDYVPERAIRRTRFFKDFLEAEGWIHGVTMIFWEDGQIGGRLCFSRTRNQGYVTDEELASLEDLHAHFSVAVQRVRRLESERAARAKLGQNDSRQPPAMMLLDDRCAPILHNRAAVKICALWRFGAERARTLKPQFALPDEIRFACESIRQESQQCGRSRGRRAGTEATRTVTHPECAGLRATIQLLRLRPLPAARQHFLIHLVYCDTQEPDLSVLESLGRLTATELAVAKLVAWGMDNQQIASELRVSVNTIRTHLQHTFHKLGIGSRGKLGVLLRRAIP